MATVAPWSAATARSVSANATSGWKAPTCVPAAIAGSRTSAPSAPLVWTMAWPLYIRTLGGEVGDRVVGDRDDDELDLLDEGLRFGERPRAVQRRGDARTPVRVAARDGVDRPAGPDQGGAERGPDGTTADDPGRGPLTGAGVPVGVRVTVRVHLVAVAVVTGRDRVEVDARLGDGRLGLGAVALRVVAGQRTPRLHRVTWAVAASAARARYASTHRV